MFIGEVVGNVWGTRKHKSLENKRLLLVRPIDPLTEKPLGDAIMAMDTCGSGPGSVVLVMDEGGSARGILKDEAAPVRTVVVGIVDSLISGGKVKNMREQDLRKIVEEIVGVLAQKGYLKDGDCGCAEKKTTVGSAGKVFSEEWSYKKQARPQSKVDPKPAAAKGGADEHEHTGTEHCPRCAVSEHDLKAVGADRIAVCHPTKKGTNVARYVDHTMLKPNATQEEIAKLCEEARSFCFASVCINPSYVALCSQLLRGSGVKICTVVGFPLGSTTPTVKAIEARDAIANGADEIDMVINVGALKSGNDVVVYDDIKAVRDATRGHVLKVILETSFLTAEEKVRACAMSKKAGADFVKTSTGFGGGGATVEDIKLMRQTVGPLMGVKASGGIRDAAGAAAMIAAGATRLGTSASVAIVTDSKSEGKGY